jgi:tetratricopeptide (TPR) repeat protein
MSHMNIGLFLSDTGKHEEALVHLQKCLEIQLKVFETSEHPLVAASWSNVGEELRYMGKYEEAPELHMKSLDIKTRIYGDSHLHVARPTTTSPLSTRYKASTRRRWKCPLNRSIWRWKCPRNRSTRIYGGCRHLSAANSFGNLGEVYRHMHMCAEEGHQGLYAEALD